MMFLLSIMLMAMHNKVVFQNNNNYYYYSSLFNKNWINNEETTKFQIKEDGRSPSGKANIKRRINKADDHRNTLEKRNERKNEAFYQNYYHH